jgi:hypothetical protein
MKELLFRHKVVDMLEEHKFHVSMVESGETASGIPDLNYCLNGVEGWIELKTIDKEEAPHIRPAQRRWIRKRIANFGRVWLLCHQESTGKVYLVHGRVIMGLSTFKTWRELCLETTPLEQMSSILPWLTGTTWESQS